MARCSILKEQVENLIQGRDRVGDEISFLRLCFMNERQAHLQSYKCCVEEKLREEVDDNKRQIAFNIISRKQGK